MNIPCFHNRTAMAAMAAMLALPPAALAEDMPTFQLTVKNGRFYPET